MTRSRDSSNSKSVHEKTFFEIGGVLSALQKRKWFDPFDSLDQWVEKNTALSRSKARALIQIYDAVVTSGAKWAKVQHLGWTKLNAIAGVLNGVNADQWIEAASIHSRAEIKQLLQEHLGGSAGRKPGGSTATRVKTFKFRDDQIKTVQAAIDRAKNIAGVEDDSAALAVICEAYADGRSLMETLADYLSGLDADERANFGAAVNARVTPSRRHGPAKGLFIGVEVVQPAGFGVKSSRADVGPYDDFLQIDAPVNQGNSGSPTFNAQGEVVGVDTAIFSPSGGGAGIGSAVASDLAKGVVQQLKDNGEVARGFLGVLSMKQDIADSLGLKDAKGAIVGKVVKDSPAAAAGLKDGDVIASVNGESVADWRDFARKIAALGPKKDAELTIVRNGSPQTVTVTLGALTDDKQAQADADSQGSSSKDAMAKYSMTLAPAAEVDGAGETGVVVADVDPDGPAAQKGIRTGDVILEVAGSCRPP
jgi:PDZ domain/Trypsin-like peptidase domain